MKNFIISIQIWMKYISKEFWWEGMLWLLKGPWACLGAVYTMDHEVVPRKRPILRGTTSWDDFHGPSY
jgi:hypothetical protein